MIVKFESDELYPVYYISKSGKFIDGEVELTEEELQDFIECQDKFNAWQKRLDSKIRGY